LVFGAYAAVVVRRPARSAVASSPLTDEGVFLTANPKGVPPGWKAVNLYKASDAAPQQCTCQVHAFSCWLGCISVRRTMLNAPPSDHTGIE
jgi:hypothetical protein